MKAIDVLKQLGTEDQERLVRESNIRLNIDGQWHTYEGPSLAKNVSSELVISFKGTQVRELVFEGVPLKPGVAEGADPLESAKVEGPRNSKTEGLPKVTGFGKSSK